MTTFTVREPDAATGRQASPPRSLGPHRWVQGFVAGGRALTTELLPLGTRPGPGWVELVDARTGRRVRRLGPVGATMATAQGALVGYNTGCARRPAPRARYGASGPAWVVECAALSVVNVETGQRWHAVDGHGWTIPMPLSPDGRWLSYVRRPRPSGPVELSVTGPARQRRVKLDPTVQKPATKDRYAASETSLGTGGPYGAVPGRGEARFTLRPWMS